MVWFACFMLVAGLTCCLIPWEERTFNGGGPRVTYFIAAGFAWGGVCVLGGYFAFKAFGQRIIIDQRTETLTIKSPAKHVEIPVSDLSGIQICDDKNSAYQVNLVYSNAAGKIARHCLYSAMSKRHCVQLANQYHTRCGLTVFDHTVN